MRRIVLLSVVLVLDFVASIIVPTVIILRYVLQFNFSAGRFDSKYTYDDVWTSTALEELRLLLVSSEMDTLLSLVAGFRSVHSVKGLIHRAAVKPQSVSRRSTSSHKPTPAPRVRVHRARTALHALGVLWSVAVLMCDYFATQHQGDGEIKSCALRMSPWFAVNATCAVVLSNCY